MLLPTNIGCYIRKLLGIVPKSNCRKKVCYIAVNVDFFECTFSCKTVSVSISLWKIRSIHAKCIVWGRPYAYFIGHITANTFLITWKVHFETFVNTIWILCTVLSGFFCNSRCFPIDFVLLFFRLRCVSPCVRYAVVIQFWLLCRSVLGVELTCLDGRIGCLPIFISRLWTGVNKYTTNYQIRTGLFYW